MQHFPLIFYMDSIPKLYLLSVAATESFMKHFTKISAILSLAMLVGDK